VKQTAWILAVLLVLAMLGTRRRLVSPSHE